MSEHTCDGGSDEGGGDAGGQALPPELAFVVQLRGRPTHNGRLLQGRVEHVVSGDTLRFDSTAELIDFLKRPLDPPPT